MTREVLQSELQVKYGTKVYTDDAVVYERECNCAYVHEFVNDAELRSRSRSRQRNGELLEFAQAGLKGTYVAVEPFHRSVMWMSRYSDTTIAPRRTIP